MIVRMKENSTKNQYDKIVDFLKEKNLEVKDVSSETVKIFGIIGDTTGFEPNDLYAFDGVADVTRVSTPFKKASRSFHPENTVIKFNNGVEIGGNQFVMMAGPCSVESEDQLRTIAKELKKSGVRFLRGGAYKPRTSPYSFQGLGLEGLKILRKVADEFDMLVVTELMSPDVLDEFEKYVDIIQIGARNMQNFSLLKELGRSTKPILLKRGIAATIQEWLMSAEYVMANGNEDIIMCERGIRTYETYTRNTLDISAVLAIKELSHLPVIVDPSHAAGRWNMIESLSLASLAVGADGLIVEVHHDPEHAMSDGAQSLKPHKYDQMVKKLEKIAPTIDKKIV
ncbi:MAG: 3-deoxy-7-phosphoheptulonate synthase [Acholeplasmataceae bacterium]